MFRSSNQFWRESGRGLSETAPWTKHPIRIAYQDFALQRAYNTLLQTPAERINFFISLLMRGKAEKVSRSKFFSEHASGKNFERVRFSVLLFNRFRAGEQRDGGKPLIRLWAPRHDVL
ncbi:MAG: hypothetical protein A3I44_05805 [Candidatus Sungbacteria bacterium RIFCSPLOWO2_02_FULL_51_17]|uniref:Uncharacterized protein n=1 Tax=Candidatus Sungbacteria bacterium RIFCSPHIGHO2_02_FULL_51_29 TaxID=1802273 RepID=A0A1G2KSK3_9BACT|nr:MAG: hypothetical protein A2676_04995 [Candidatus Sungbacteria bacterium RIFCSPHIGHO2_01_FULL_51_22]OHA02333.1 MAG: hypothetical protein A3C16_04230 [Candidatus Sungbacteria bacterium RIFCSPHIGHO2_02_FULL_51_29]OHA05380.1 MAG: hypothetical protein A3B29_00785 [Candidatus Sungbacteria bacterium RIFCSPLOWO2_01_FULL_51_34]OHA12065.1 MAG: hypothetical protein A3I44_05805 [Candidatus Sungbacteria bacterium RIFCSPLOWO2_02_FULL_51_17]